MTALPMTKYVDVGAGPNRMSVAPRNVWFVDSNVDDTSGRTPETAFGTTNEAIDAASANDTLIWMPGHSENIADATAEIDFDVAGLNCIGLGRGTARPRFDFDDTDAIMSVGASNVHIQNIVLRPGVALCVVGIAVETLFTDVFLEDIEIIPGEAGDGTDEFVDAITVAATCDRFHCKGLKYTMHSAGDGQQSALNFGAASDRVHVEDFWIEMSGAALVAGIECGAALTRALVENGTITMDAEPGLEMSTSTGSLSNIKIFSDLATIDAATVATNMAHFDVRYCEVGNEAGTLVKTESIDD